MFFIVLNLFYVDEASSRRETASGFPTYDYANDDEESRRRKVEYCDVFSSNLNSLDQVPFAKPVPKSFEKAWRSVEPYPTNENNNNRMLSTFSSNQTINSTSFLF